MDESESKNLRDEVMRAIWLDLTMLERALEGKTNGFGVPDAVLAEAMDHIEQLRELLADAPIVLRNRQAFEKNISELRYRDGQRQLWEAKTNIVSLSQWGMFLNGNVAKLPEGRSKAQRARLAQLRAEVTELYRAGPA